MALFKKRGFRIIRFILKLVFAAIALYLLFRGIINDNIVSGV